MNLIHLIEQLCPIVPLNKENRQKYKKLSTSNSDQARVKGIV